MLNRMLVALSFCWALAGPSPAGAADTDFLPFKATEATLANGLKVIVVPTGLPNLVSLQIPVQTGSRNEIEAGKTGFAHFFEHMMFRGTKAFSAENYGAILKKAGVGQNAFTTDDFTNYHTTFAKEDLETILKLEADRFQHLDYSEDAFKTESRAVLGEYNKNSANPRAKLYEAQRDAAFRSHTYKHTTMGFLEDIENMPNQFAYSKQFFDRWYRPEYTTIVIAGDVEPARALALVAKYWGGWKRGGYRASVAPEPAPTGPVYRHVDWPTPTPSLVSVAFHGPRFSDTAKDQAALSLLLSLSFGPTSPLYKRLVQDEQLVDAMSESVPQRVDPNLAAIATRVKKPGDVVAVRDAILQTVARLRSDPVSAKALADAKSAERYGLIQSLESTEEIADNIVAYAHFGRSYDTLNRYYRVVDSLTPDDLSAAARRYLVDDGMVVTTLSNEPMPPAMAALPTLASLAPRSAAAPLGMLVQRSALPQIRFKLVFDAGSAYDPPGKEGLAALTASMLASAGSTERSSSEVKQAMFPLAGRFAAQVDKEMTTFTGSVHQDRWTEFVDIAMPLLLSPGFRDDDFKRLRDSQANALRVDLKNNNEEELAKERLQANVYAGTPYGHPVLGSEKSIASLTLDDVRSFARRAYTQGALHVGIAGAVTEAMTASLQRALAGLPAGPGLPASGIPVGHVADGLAVEIVEKDTRSTAISFGAPIAVTRSSPDFAALTVARSWLGEHRNSNSLLYQRIREARGMNYGDYAYIEAFPRGGNLTYPPPNVSRKAQLFEVWIRPVTTPENAHLALRIALTEIDKLVTDGMTAEQFESTREFLMKYVFLMTSTQDEQLGYGLDSQWYGTPEYTATMRTALSRLSLADVNAAIRRHFSGKNLSVVIVTKDGAAMKARLVADTFSGIKYDGDQPAELLREDQAIGARKLGIRPQAVTVTPLAKVFSE
ncbi:MAG: insulinase family protein [Pseudomonadota bacterium]|nr:insulinase family protein [Pseudomonadota bacterium]